MIEGTERIEVHRGRKGVYFDRSRVCFIDGRAGELLYRGYSIHDLAERSTFEETCYLLFKDELPTAAQLEAFDAELTGARTLPAATIPLLVMDMYEHSYQMDFGATTAKYVDAFFQNIRWESVLARLEQTRKSMKA